MAAPFLRAATKDMTLSACDECRARKLKCSREPTGCSRCLAEQSICHYSPRKTMGRPRKRQLQEKDHIPVSESVFGDFQGIGYGSTRETLDPALKTNTGCGTATLEFQSVPDEIETQGMGFAGNGDGFYSGSSNDNTFQGLDVSSFSPTIGFPAWDPALDLHSLSALDSINTAPPQTTSSLDGGTSSSPSLGTERHGCLCLQNLYSTLATFQAPPAPSFPHSMGALRKALRYGYEVVRCQTCPRGYNTAVQNSMLLGALLHMLIHEYAKLLKHIDERAASGESIAFRVGEVSSCSDERHTGMPDCPMGINLDLNGDEWRMLARKGVRQEVLGSCESNETLLSIVQEMRDRQLVWHENVSRLGHPHDGQAQSDAASEPARRDGDPMCAQVTYIDHLKRMLDALEL